MIRILIADDQNLIRQGIKALLESEPELEVVATAEDGLTAIEQAEICQPDIVLIDIEMPHLDGLTAIQYICQHFPNIKVIVLSSHENEEYFTKALQAGANGYLLKNTLAEDLIQAIKTVNKGYSQLEPKLLAKVVAQLRIANAAISRYDSATIEPRQRQVQNRNSDSLNPYQGHAQAPPSNGGVLRDSVSYKKPETNPSTNQFKARKSAANKRKNTANAEVETFAKNRKIDQWSEQAPEGLSSEVSMSNRIAPRTEVYTPRSSKGGVISDFKPIVEPSSLQSETYSIAQASTEIKPASTAKSNKSSVPTKNKSRTQNLSLLFVPRWWLQGFVFITVSLLITSALLRFIYGSSPEPNSPSTSMKTLSN